MQTSTSEVFEDSVRRSGEELFRGLGAPLQFVGAGGVIRVEPRHVGGLIGFAGDRAEGSLLLVSTFELAARLRPAVVDRALSSSVSRDWLVIRDWIGELSNRLVGRMKNRLLPMGFDLRVATPLALSGQGLAAATQPRLRPRVLAFSHGSEAVWIVLSIVEKPALASAGARTGADPALREGDIVEF